MKKNKNNNNQLPPHLLGYWVKGLIKDGAIIKKKIVHDIKIKIDITESTKNDPTDDTDDDDIMYYIKKLLRFTIFLEKTIRPYVF